MSRSGFLRHGVLEGLRPVNDLLELVQGHPVWEVEGVGDVSLVEPVPRDLVHIVSHLVPEGRAGVGGADGVCDGEPQLLHEGQGPLLGLHGAPGEADDEEEVEFVSDVSGDPDGFPDLVNGDVLPDVPEYSVVTRLDAEVDGVETDIVHGLHQLLGDVVHPHPVSELGCEVEPLVADERADLVDPLPVVGEVVVYDLDFVEAARALT